MKKFLFIAGGCIAFAAVWTACKIDPSLDDNQAVPSLPVRFDIPENWPQPAYTFKDNELTQAGFDLGRRLFYETRLSRDNLVSCGTCHQQFAAFANLDHATSHGVDGLFGTRNAPPLFNLAWHPAYFWDGREPDLEAFPRHPITDPVEMDETISNIIGKLSADEAYRQLFRNAYGSESITEERIFKALAQFQAVLISADSKYDKYIRGEAGGSLTPQEQNGLRIFRQKCESCHREPLFTDFSYRNNGLAPSPLYQDSGRARFTKKTEDVFRFKVPSLRNVALSRQYMHDGRFDHLPQVMDHYSGTKYGYPTLDSVFTNGFTLTEAEKDDLLSFLQTLTDNRFVTDQRFSEPPKQ